MDIPHRSDELCLQCSFVPVAWWQDQDPSPSAWGPAATPAASTTPLACQSVVKTMSFSNGSRRKHQDLQNSLSKILILSSECYSLKFSVWKALENCWSWQTWTLPFNPASSLFHILRACVMYTEKCVMKTHTSLLIISEKNSKKRKAKIREKRMPRRERDYSSISNVDFHNVVELLQCVLICLL